MCVCVCVEWSDSHVKGSAAAQVGASPAEARPLLSIQRRRPNTADGHVHCSCSLAGVYLVLHWTRRTRSEPSQLDSWYCLLSVLILSVCTIIIIRNATYAIHDTHIQKYNENISQKRLK